MPFDILNFSSPLSVSNTTETSVSVSGLASVSGRDRDGDEVADPREFNIQTFLNSPTLLMDHDFIKDQSGNNSAAGSIKTAIPVVISQNPSNEDEFVLKNINDGEFVTVWPKNKSPESQLGDTGLFVVAEVTHPLVISKVNRGELGAFSWKGFANTIESVNGITQLKNIDLIEISLVHMPSRNQATFRVLSDDHSDLELSLKDCSIFEMGFQKQKYSLTDIKEYTKKLDLTNPQISENADNYFVSVGSSNSVNSEQAFSIPLGDRTLHAAPKIKKTILEFSPVGELTRTKIKESEMPDTKTGADNSEKAIAQKLYLLNEDSLKAIVPNAVVELQKSTTTVDDVAIDVFTIELPVGEVAEEAVTEEVVEVVVETPEPEVVVETPAEEVSDVSKLALLLESLSQKVDTLSAEKEVQVQAETAEQIKSETEKAIQSQLEAFKAAERKTEQEREKLAKQLAALNNQIPNEQPRQEQLVQKSAGQASSASAAPASKYTGFGGMYIGTTGGTK